MPAPTSVIPSFSPESGTHVYWQSSEASVFFGKVVLWVSAIMLIYGATRWALDGSVRHGVGPLIIAGGGLAAWLLRRRGRMYASFLVYVWVVWLAISVQPILQAGLGNAGLHGYLVLIVATGWMMGRRHAIAVGVATIAYVLALAVAIQHGGWVPLAPLPPVSQAIALSIVWIIALMLLTWILKVQSAQLQATQALNENLTRMVAERDAQNAALVASEQRFSVIIKASPVPIAISQPDDGRYIDVNPAWARELGWSRDEAINQSSVSLGFWSSSAERDRWIAQFRRDGRSLGHELQVMTRDGRERTMLLSAELIDYNGQEALLSMFVDVTDRKRIEAELHGLNEALEQRVAERTAELAASNQELSSAMATLTRTQDELVHSEKLASLGKLVAGVAHELNTPIGNALTASSTVTGVARQFVKTMESGTVRRSALTSFVSQMHDGANLIERSLYRAADLLASFKQVAIDQASERRRPFDLAHVVRDVVDTLRPTLKAQPWVIEVTIPDGIAMESFPGPIDQIVINLVMNATIHAFAGRDHGRVCLAVENLAADTLDLVCSDDGVGIPSEHLGRVFDPFFTSRLGHGGSGLGLSITHRLTTQVLGGQISLSSVVGEGTRFVLHLPRQAPEVVS